MLYIVDVISNVSKDPMPVRAFEILLATSQNTSVELPGHCKTRQNRINLYRANERVQGVFFQELRPGNFSSLSCTTIIFRRAHVFGVSFYLFSQNATSMKLPEQMKPGKIESSFIVSKGHKTYSFRNWIFHLYSLAIILFLLLCSIHDTRTLIFIDP